MLAERYDMIHCGENYHDAFPRDELSRWKQPGLCYFDTMTGWQEWLNMTPEEHWNWTHQVSEECVEIEILELLKISAYNRVAIMLCDPPDICATRFFDRDDPDKKFMMEQIRRCPDPDAALQNFNSWALYHPPLEIDWAHTGFFAYTRSDFENDTREEVLSALAKHFGLEAEK